MRVSAISAGCNSYAEPRVPRAPLVRKNQYGTIVTGAPARRLRFIAKTTTIAGALYAFQDANGIVRHYIQPREVPCDARHTLFSTPLLRIAQHFTLRLYRTFHNIQPIRGQRFIRDSFSIKSSRRYCENQSSLLVSFYVATFTSFRFYLWNSE